MSEKLKLALPSKGMLGQSSLDFLKKCGISVQRRNDREYTGYIKEYPDAAEVIFQRAEDIPDKIRNGDVDLGITGLDIVREYLVDEDEEVLSIIIESLGFGKANLVVAVPDDADWDEIVSMYKLYRLSHERNTDKNILKIASKFKGLAKEFLEDKHKIYNYNLVTASGVLELAPKMKIADLIIDLTSTGNTLRANNLKLIDGGLILKSQACLIGNTKAHALKNEIVDKIESHLRARKYIRIMTNIKYHKKEEVERKLKNSLKEKKIEPSSFNISHSLSLSSDSDTVINLTMVVKETDLYHTISTLRGFKASEIASSRIDYLFLNKSTLKR